MKRLFPSLVGLAIVAIAFASPRPAMSLTCPLITTAVCVPIPSPSIHPTATPVPVVTPTPAPAPTARAATSSEIGTFMQFAPAPPPGGSWGVDQAVIGGQWALVGFYNNYSGITALLVQNSAGQWTLAIRGGGQFTPTAMVNHLPGLSLSLATAMYNLAMTQDQ